MIRDLTLTGYIFQTIVCVKNMYLSLDLYYIEVDIVTYHMNYIVIPLLYVKLSNPKQISYNKQPTSLTEILTIYCHISYVDIQITVILYGL